MSDGRITVPVHDGPTYLTAAGPLDKQIAALGPIRRDNASENRLLSAFDRVTSFGRNGLLVWDDDEALLVSFTGEEEARWRLPDTYRGAPQPQISLSPDGSGVAISVGCPKMLGWAAHQGSVCMVIRPLAEEGTHLLWLEWDGEASNLPMLRRIDHRFLLEPVSCGVVDETVVVVNETEVLVFRLCDSPSCQGE